MTNEYIDMWKDLGINLERHEQLLNGLSEYVKESILSQKNRPATMDYFNFVLSEIHGLRIKELAELKKQGKKTIGAFCLYAPEEIAYAADPRYAYVEDQTSPLQMQKKSCPLHFAP